MEAVLSPPQPFHFINTLENFTSGNLAKKWAKWKNAFLIYHEACEMGAKSEKVQISIFLHVIGAQCRKVYTQFDEDFASMSDVLKKFDSFFQPKKNLTTERHIFFTRNQNQCESIEQYLAVLKKLADACEFNELNEDLVRDRLICGILDDVLRERLLRDPTLTLERCLDICKTAQAYNLNETSEHQTYTSSSFNYGYEYDGFCFRDTGSSHNQMTRAPPFF